MIARSKYSQYYQDILHRDPASCPSVFFAQNVRLHPASGLMIRSTMYRCQTLSLFPEYLSVRRTLETLFA
jgi:hypothetical protein